jgi:TRAP-type C4-dicarboxylate transport system substrate-binding protein
MSNLIRVAVLLAALSPLSVLAQTVWRYSNWLPPTHPVSEGVAKVWAQQVEQATEGRVKIEILAPLGAPPAHLDLVRNGVADVAGISTTYTAGRFILLRGLEMPFMSDSNSAMSIAAYRTYEKFFAKANEFQGVKLAGLALVGPNEVYTTKKPIHSIDDFKGLKLREAGGTTKEVAELLGATPFFVPAPQVYDVLSKGVGDGVLFPPESIPSFKLNGVVRYGVHVPGGFHQTAFAFIINQAKWNALSPADQAAISKLTGEHMARLWGELWDKTNADAIEQMNKGGVKIETASPALLADIRKRLSSLETGWIAEAAKKGVDGRAALEYMRAEVKALEKK